MAQVDPVVIAKYLPAQTPPPVLPVKPAPKAPAAAKKTTAPALLPPPGAPAPAR
jgi:hypothetical protein